MTAHAPAVTALGCALAFTVALAGGGSAAVPAGIDGASRDLTAIVADVEAGRRTTPVVGAVLPGGDVPVTFLARRSRGRAPRIVSDVTGWGERPDGTFDAEAGRMTPVGRTGWYSLEVRVAPAARVEYQIAYAVGDHEHDPYNPRRVDSPPASEFVTPGYESPAALAGPPALPVGELRAVVVESRALGRGRDVVVYVPPGLPPVDRPLVVFLDRRATRVARVLDWLVEHGSVEPFVAAFVGLDPPGDGASSAAAHRAFLVEELPAWLAAHEGTARDEGRRGIVAISFAAKDALDAAGSRAGYGRLGLLIPGRRITPGDIAALRTVIRAPLRVSILAGQYDLANVETARHLRRALTGAGHDVAYREVPEGHSPRTWLHHLDGVLTDLFPPRSLQGPEPRSRR